MIVKKAIPGQYFDIDSPLNETQAAEFAKAGYLGGIRYLPRASDLVAGNLSMAEIEIMLAAGLGISAVQHVSPNNWNPTAILGSQYGQYASQYAHEIGLPSGMHIWLDLEMVNTSATVADITAYCTNWFNAVQAGGFLGALYVGWQAGLNSHQLYINLPFKAYWKGYNADISVDTRGYMITQHPQQSLNGIFFDPNAIGPDDIGRLPMLLYPS
jgi:Domain of unknown function (DUF1906)